MQIPVINYHFTCSPKVFKKNTFRLVEFWLIGVKAISTEAQTWGEIREYPLKPKPFKQRSALRCRDTWRSVWPIQFQRISWASALVNKLYLSWKSFLKNRADHCDFNHATVVYYVQPQTQMRWWEKTQAHLDERLAALETSEHRNYFGDMPRWLTVARRPILYT